VGAAESPAIGIATRRFSIQHIDAQLVRLPQKVAERRGLTATLSAMTNGRLVQAFVALLASGPVHADALDHAVNEAMKKNNVPGTVVLVARDGKVLKRAAYGLASVELSTALKADHIFPLASITKVFTATAVLLLVQEGKLRLEQSIGEVLPDLQVRSFGPMGLSQDPCTA
jgi:CubicO group peptidase (beta-lactamase class C family)